MYSMSQAPSASVTELQASIISRHHNRSFSEQSTSAQSSNAVPVSSPFNSSCRGRRTAAGVTTLQKRRFRTQSSTVGHGLRRAVDPAATAPIVCSGGEHMPVVVHSRPTGDRKADKGVYNGEVAENKTRSSSDISVSIHKAKIKEGTNKNSGVFVLPKITRGGSQSNLAQKQRLNDASRKKDVSVEKKAAEESERGEHEAPQELSISTIVIPSPSTETSPQAVKKQNSCSMQRGVQPTRSVKDTTGEPLTSSTAVIPDGNRRDPPRTAPTTHKRGTGGISSSTNVDDATVLAISKPKTSSLPPRELPLPSSESKATKATESVTPKLLNPSHGFTQANGGNNNNGMFESKATAAPVEALTPILSHHDSGATAAGTTSSQHSSHVSQSAENASAFVVLPRVTSLQQMQRTVSQVSLNNAQRACGTSLQSSTDSAGADASRGTSPASQSLKLFLQPHLPTVLHRVSSNNQMAVTAPLQLVQTVPPTISATNVSTVSSSLHSTCHLSDMQYNSAHLPSCHAAHSGPPSTSGKPKNSVSLPTIISLHNSPISLRNFGATCYLNSVVQCLLHTPGLLRSLDKDRQRIIQEWEGKKGGRFDEAHRRSCAELNAPATSALLDLGTAKPKQETPMPQLLLSLKAACGECNEEFAGNGQNDAHELLITLLGVIDKEVCRSKPKAYQTMKDIEGECKRDAYARWTERLRQENNSTVYDFFGGVTGCTVQCATCSLISYRFEALLDISLPMAYSSASRAAGYANSSDGKNGKGRPEEVVAVDLLLDDMFFSSRGELLSGSMQVTCDRCKKLRDKTIWVTIEQWPPILVLHLKRFNNAGVKNESAVVFPYTFCPYGHVKYQLYGVCCHRGTSSFGHYTSYIFADNDDAAAAELPMRKSFPGNGDHEDHADAICNSRVVNHARSAGGDLCLGEKNDVSQSETTPPTAAHGSSTSTGNGGSGKGGKWYFCNDESISPVTASEVVSKTKEAYILFYRRFA